VRVVLDTNVFVSGLMLPQSVPGKIVAAWRGAHFELVLSEPMLAEIGRVLSYPKIRARLGWSDDEIANFLLLLRFKAEFAEVGDVRASVPGDPSDTPVLATLLASGADCLVSGDAHLLALRHKHPILAPAELAGRL
jgi:uncharacterized protein